MTANLGTPDGAPTAALDAEPDGENSVIKQVTPPATRPRAITARAFHDALLAAGIVHEGDRIRRIVIDAKADDVLLMYVERYGDERWLHVVPTLDGIEVRTRPEPENAAPAPS